MCSAEEGGKAGKRKEPVGEAQVGMQRAAWDVFLWQGTAQATEEVRGVGAEFINSGSC